MIILVGLAFRPQDSEVTQETSMLPFYKPPTDRERLEYEASKPFSERKGRFAKSRPMTVGLFNEEARSQVDLLDWLASRKEGDSSISPAGK